MSNILRDTKAKAQDISALINKTLKRAAYIVLNNILVEILIISIIAACFLTTSMLDRVFHTRLKYVFLSKLRGISRDRLGPLRKAQIKYIFRLAYGLSRMRIRLAGGSYWLSIPCIVEGVDRRTGEDKRYLAKIINDRSAIKYKYITFLRNLAIMAGGADIRFEEYSNAWDMVRSERNCLEELRSRSVDTPAVLGLHRLNEDDYILIMEFIEGEPLSRVSIGRSEIDSVFRIVKTMHDNKLVHGDIKLDNFIYSNGRIFVIDCIRINRGAIHVAQSFDLICAICTLVEMAPMSTVMEYALKYFTQEELLHAGTMIDIAVTKADINLPEYKIRELKAVLGRAA